MIDDAVDDIKSRATPDLRDRLAPAEARLADVAELVDESELVELRRVSDVLEAP